MDDLPLLLGVGAVVVLVSVLAVRLSTRVGLPSLLLYLAIGVLLGESGLGIRFDDAALTQALGVAALVLILADGGLTTRWTTVRPALGLGVALSTVAVAVSIGVTGLALRALLGLDLRIAFLWGAVLSSTDAAAVFSVLRNLGLKGRLVGALELESGLNDAPVFLAVVLLSSTAALSWTDPLLVVYELVAGASDRRRARASGGAGPAPRRAAGHRALPAGHDRRLRPGLRLGAAPARLRPARDLRRGAGAGQLDAAAPRGRPVVRRGPGLARPDRAVRAARALRLPGPPARPRSSPR